MDLLCKRDFMASPYRSEREKIIFIQRWSVRKFFKLLEKLDTFFAYDKCYRLADNYLIAMVFTYFLRASLEPDEFTTQHFFAALLLAYNMEEDEGENLLMELEPWLECSVPDLKATRDELFQRIEYRGTVSSNCCKIVMRSANPEHKIWLRARHVYHSGIINKKCCCFKDISLQETDICPICHGDSEEEIDY